MEPSIAINQAEINAKAEEATIVFQEPNLAENSRLQQQLLRAPGDLREAREDVEVCVRGEGGHGYQLTHAHCMVTNSRTPTRTFTRPPAFLAVCPQDLTAQEGRERNAAEKLTALRCRLQETTNPTLTLTLTP